jgi:hypothetical protein
MAKQNEALFEESSQGAVGVSTAIGFIVSMVLMLGGFVLMSYAFTADPAAGLWEFVGGLVAVFVGFMIPFSYRIKPGK